MTHVFIGNWNPKQNPWDFCFFSIDQHVGLRRGAAPFTHCQPLLWFKIGLNFGLNVTRNLVTGFCPQAQLSASWLWTSFLIYESSSKSTALLFNESWGTYIWVERYFEEIDFSILMKFIIKFIKYLFYILHYISENIWLTRKYVVLHFHSVE